MVFRATSSEIAAVLECKAEWLEKTGCRGITSNVERLESGMLYLSLSESGDDISRAFDKGASCIVGASGATPLPEAIPYTLLVDSPVAALWKLFHWWRSSQEAPFLALVGAPPFTVWMQEISAHFFLSKSKGLYRGAQYCSGGMEEEIELASEVMNSEEGTEWYLLALHPEMKSLLSALEPKVILHESELPESPSEEEALPFMENGKVGYLSSDLTLSLWPVPLLSAARIVRSVLEWSKELGMSFSEDEVLQVGARFFPPPYMGFHISLGDVGSLWIERVSPPRMEDIEALLRDSGGVHIGCVVEEDADFKALSSLSPQCRLFLWPQESESIVASFQEIVEPLLSAEPFFLVVFVNDEELGEQLFHLRDELYQIAQERSR